MARVRVIFARTSHANKRSISLRVRTRIEYARRIVRQVSQ